MDVPGDSDTKDHKICSFVSNGDFYRFNNFPDVNYKLLCLLVEVVYSTVSGHINIFYTGYPRKNVNVQGDMHKNGHFFWDTWYINI